MKEKILSILIVICFTGIILFAFSVGINDCRNETGAFAKSGDVYPVTAARMASKKAGFQESETNVVIFIEPETETAESEVFDEQETSEETTSETDPGDLDQEYTGDETVPKSMGTDPETEDAQMETETECYKEQYSVAGHVCQKEITDYLRQCLSERGIEWWMPYAVCTMFQESHFRPDAVSKNGKDKGLLQYREKYWAESMGDIFDYHAQIRRYVDQTANRINAGCSIEETISRHKQSDWGSFDPVYVQQVMQWFDRIEVE